MLTQAVKDATDELKLAKITLMMQKDTVFYTTILFSLEQEITDAIPTAGTDGRRLLINPVFFSKQTPGARIGLLAHEVLHVALDHMHRIGPTRDRQIWNIAADYVINGFLVKANYELPPGGLIDKKYDNKTTEEVYDLIKKESEQTQQQLIDKCKASGMNGNDINYPESAPEGKQVSQDEVTGIILRAVTQAKSAKQSAGCVPGEVAIELTRILNPPLPWHNILQNYLTDMTQDDYSFRRPNKRFMPDFYLPSALSECLEHLAFAVDASGSVSDADFNDYITKIDDIQKLLKPKKITVISFDTSLKSVQVLTENDNPFTKLKFHGRGGTQIKPVHEWAAVAKPKVLIVFTDGEFRQIEPIDKTVPIIWLIHNDPKWKADFGRVVHFSTKRK